MSDRASNLCSGGGLAVAVVGGALHDVAISVLGPVLGLVAHFIIDYRDRKKATAKNDENAYLKMRNYQLEMLVAQLRGTVPKPPETMP